MFLIKKSKLLCFFILLVSSLLPVYPLDFFELNDTSELSKLIDNQIVIRSLEDANDLSLNPIDYQASLIINSIKEKKPSYITEVFQIIPVKDNENFLLELNKLLLDTKEYINIDYYSEYNDQTVPLYFESIETKREISGDEIKVDLRLLMKPFNQNDFRIACKKDTNSLFFEMTNKKPMVYKKIACVSVNNFHSYIYCKKIGENYYLYSVGYVKIPKIISLQERIRVSFVNRVKSFCTHIFVNPKLGYVKK